MPSSRYDHQETLQLYKLNILIINCFTKSYCSCVIAKVTIPYSRYPLCLRYSNLQRSVCFLYCNVVLYILNKNHFNGIRVKIFKFDSKETAECNIVAVIKKIILADVNLYASHVGANLGLLICLHLFLTFYQHLNTFRLKLTFAFNNFCALFLFCFSYLLSLFLVFLLYLILYLIVPGLCATNTFFYKPTILNVKTP